MQIPLRVKREIALTTTRLPYYVPSRGFRDFLAEAIPEEVAKVIRAPITSQQVVQYMIEGWQWKNKALNLMGEKVLDRFFADRDPSVDDLIMVADQLRLRGEM